MTLKLSDFWHRLQGELFPALAEEVGSLLGTHRRFVAALDLVGVEGFAGAPGGGSPSGGPTRAGFSGCVGPSDDAASDRQKGQACFRPLHFPLAPAPESLSAVVEVSEDSDLRSMIGPTIKGR